MHTTIQVLAFDGKQNINVDHRREDNFTRSYKLIGFDEAKKEHKTWVDLRLYHPKKGQYYYCCVWILTGDVHNGSGKRYLSSVDAAQEALTQAGLTFSRKMEHSYLEHEIEEALKAIANYLNVPNPYIIKNHP